MAVKFDTNVTDEELALVQEGSGSDEGEALNEEIRAMLKGLKVGERFKLAWDTPAESRGIKRRVTTALKEFKSIPATKEMEFARGTLKGTENVLIIRRVK